MYCVKCGVRLGDGVRQCPLCQTPVWCPDETVKADTAFSSAYPAPPRSARYPVLAFLTVICAAACLTTLILCLKTYGRVAWSGYVMLGLAVFYFSFCFPAWFDRPHPMVFLPMFFALSCGYLLYICLATGGRWFLSFAFPVVMLVGLLVTVGVALYRYIRGGRLFITGALLIAMGGFSMLVELFEAITFGTRMFTWSLYSVTVLSLFGLFLILAGMIPPLRSYLERKFFL